MHISLSVRTVHYFYPQFTSWASWALYIVWAWAGWKMSPSPMILRFLFTVDWYIKTFKKWSSLHFLQVLLKALLKPLQYSRFIWALHLVSDVPFPSVQLHTVAIYTDGCCLKQDLLPRGSVGTGSGRPSEYNHCVSHPPLLTKMLQNFAVCF